jgi:hypothetical protein
MNTAYGSVELFFSYLPVEGETVTLITNITGIRSFAGTEDLTLLPISVTIGMYNDGDDYVVVQTLLGDEVVDQSDYFYDQTIADKTFDVRIFFFNARISVYLNDKWVYTYGLRTVSYPVTITQTLRADGNDITLSDLRRVELADGREAVYVDYESNSDNAISSIIQERPIESLAAIDRMIEFTYDATKDDRNALKISSYEDQVADNSQTSSDGLVYSMDVGISLDAFTAEELGLITRLYRLPELDSGIDRAVAAIQRRARQSRIKVGTSGRFDPCLEISDVLVLDGVVVTGTSRIVSDRVIVEDVTFSVADGECRQSSSGRRDVDNV